MTGGLPSLEPISRETVRARAEQQAHFDSLDAKAGVVIGFSGILAAIAPASGDVLIIGARVFAVVAAVSALLASWPRTQPVPQALGLRARYLEAEATLTEVRLLDLRVEMIQRSSKILGIKARLLQVATAALTVSVLLIGVGMGVR